MLHHAKALVNSYGGAVLCYWLWLWLLLIYLCVNATGSEAQSAYIWLAAGRSNDEMIRLESTSCYTFTPVVRSFTGLSIDTKGTRFEAWNLNVMMGGLVVKTLYSPSASCGLESGSILSSLKFICHFSSTSGCTVNFKSTLVQCPTELAPDSIPNRPNIISI